MRLIGCLSFYDEHPAWLAACVASLAKCRLDHLVALDGAYLLLPEARAWSATSQHIAILETAHALGIGLTIRVPGEPWEGNEVQKRSALFAEALQVATPGEDWLLVIDADATVTDCPPDLKVQLAACEHDVAETLLYEDLHPEGRTGGDFLPLRSETLIRNVFRAVPGLHVAGSHYTYMTGDGRRLWGNADLEPCATIRGLRMEHRTRLRAKARKDRQNAYYRLRDQLGIELGCCARCEAPAAQIVPVGFEREGDALAAGNEPLCAQHAREQLACNEARIGELGFDPAGLQRVT